MTDTVAAVDTETAVLDACRQAKIASRSLATLTRAAKDQALHAMADALVSEAPRIVEANAIDVERERAGGMSSGLLDRLTLTEDRVAAIAGALRYVAGLPDPVGEVRRGSTLPNGLRLLQKSVPMGVVGMIYEARPNVTVDAAALCLKSGNAAVLRGGSAAQHSNEVIVDVLQGALESCGLPRDAVQSIDAYGREGAKVLMNARGLVDVLVPRGGHGLIQTVVKESSVPTIETGEGNCHVYIDASAPTERAVAIAVNSKAQRVGVCNAAETLLVHKDAAARVMPALLEALAAESVVLHGDEATSALAPETVSIVAATEEDWATEYLSLDLAVKVVDSLEDAIDHIQRYTTGHTEAIVTDDINAAEAFSSRLDTAAIMVNASTRFTDGGEFGLGAEIGISTQKLHARGPMGLGELTTTKWIAYGDGHVRP
ncbi:glutamate-5-semialdehyde dehydrogenase [Demequina zhanjiangensis]|uniref:Gamma-glutamyl phosphate reductase n=1 Tax=Demequina zhanjiangensis TaxID=3051659 RepID=A0ABT8FZU0_9MICO|nr:glutamate-5-semialdehyde dehydrogenase [Demequina sp. SYSU T00b26]MDN4472410.1 glutamate-5-semialdehyde dehydrogenase [Demequina sp. SYSU T00b26]